MSLYIFSHVIAYFIDTIPSHRHSLEFRRLFPLLEQHTDTWAVDLIGWGFTETGFGAHFTRAIQQIDVDTPTDIHQSQLPMTHCYA
jgi:hypothetical protein